MIYELREYVAKPDAADKLHERFRETTLPLFARHGLNVTGFWVDAEDPSRIVYLLSFPDAEAQRRAWQSFQNDEDWKQAKAASEADGPIVASMASRTLEPVSYWPQQRGA